jgi:tRNA(adenine34) deaminase
MPKLEVTSPATWSAAMGTALRLAERAARDREVPVGAVVLLDGKVVGRGLNRRENRNDPCGHAEIQALQSAARRLGSWRLERATLVVTLEPCPMCLAACQQARISRLVYGAKDPKGGALSLGYKLHSDNRLNHRFEVLFEDFPPAGEVLRRFFRARRRQAKRA